MFLWKRMALCVVIGIVVTLIAACGAPPVTPTPTVEFMPTVTLTEPEAVAAQPTLPTDTPVAPDTATPPAASAASTATLTTTATATATATSTSTASHTPTATDTPSATPTHTPTLTATATASATATPSPTPTPRPSDTPAPSPTGGRPESPTEDNAPPPAETLLLEDFDDEIADGWQVQGGAWGIRQREYDQSSIIKGNAVWSYHPALVAADYSAQADIKLVPEAYDGNDRRLAGLAVRMADIDNFCMAALDWSANRLFLYQWDKGQWEALASRPLLLTPDAWYTLRVVVRGPFMRASVDSAPQLEAMCARRTEGFTGLHIEAGHFRVDNVRIETAPPFTPQTTLPFTDNFSDGDSDGWHKQNGVWRVFDGALDQSYTDSGEVWATLPDLIAADCRVEARIRPLPIEVGEEVRPPSGSVGIALRMSGISYGYWGAIDLREGDLQILLRQGGGWTKLGNRPLDDTVDLTAWHTLAFEATGAHLRLYLDGDVVVEATDHTYTSGYMGILMNRGHFLIDDLRIDDTTPPPTPQGAPPEALPFMDDFDDGFADGWELVGGGWDVAGGALDQAQFYDGSEAVAWVELPARNYAITADVRLIPEDYTNDHGRWIGLLIRYAGARRGYWGVINVRDGKAQIWRGAGESWVELSPATAVELIPNDWNTLRIEAFENQLRLRVNGDLIVTANDDNWAEGAFGVRILEGHFQIDNVLVEQIDR